MEARLYLAALALELLAVVPGNLVLEEHKILGEMSKTCGSDGKSSTSPQSTMPVCGDHSALIPLHSGSLSLMPFSSTISMSGTYVERNTFKIQIFSWILRLSKADPSWEMKLLANGFV